MTAVPHLQVFVSADVASHEQMRFALKEIVRRFKADPYGFDAEEAAHMAQATLDSVAEAEQRGERARA